MFVDTVFVFGSKFLWGRGGILFFEFLALKFLGLVYRCLMEFILVKLFCINFFIFKVLFVLFFYEMNVMLFFIKCVLSFRE